MYMTTEWWQQLLFPVRRAWLALSSRLLRSRSRKEGGGLLKLRDDVQTCGYEDVQVMWELLRMSESEQKFTSHLSQHKSQTFWRVFSWTSNSSHTTSSILASVPADHA